LQSIDNGVFDDDDQYDFEDPYDDSDLSPREIAESFIRTAVLFESALAIIAVGLGWFLGQPPWVSTSWESGSGVAILLAIGLGTLATLPLIAVFYWLQNTSLGSLDELQQLMEEQIVPLFREATWLELGLISLAAGLGEEALFRGVLQSYLQSLMSLDHGPALPILLVSLLFGLVHFITKEYLLLATIMSIYLGIWFWWTGDIIVPIITHTLYDWFALMYLKKTIQEDPSDQPEQS